MIPRTDLYDLLRLLVGDHSDLARNLSDVWDDGPEAVAGGTVRWRDHLGPMSTLLRIVTDEEWEDEHPESPRMAHVAPPDPEEAAKDALFEWEKPTGPPADPLIAARDANPCPVDGQDPAGQPVTCDRLVGHRDPHLALAPDESCPVCHGLQRHVDGCTNVGEISRDEVWWQWTDTDPTLVVVPMSDPLRYTHGRARPITDVRSLADPEVTGDEADRFLTALGLNEGDTP